MCIFAVGIKACTLMEELLNALSSMIHDSLAGLRCLTPAKRKSRMRKGKIKRMILCSDFMRLTLSVSVVLKENPNIDLEEARTKIGELGKNLALYIYDLDIEEQKRIINEEAEKSKSKPSCR